MDNLKLDIGCGLRKKEGFYGIDIRNVYPDGLPLDVDLVHDLNTGIPFDDNSIEEIFASHSIEHFSNIYFMLDECLRVLKPEKILEIIVPLYEIRSVDHVTMFYPDWFERNITLPGAKYSSKFQILWKQIILAGVPEEHRSWWELRIKLQKI